jgi:hypothetical protein
MNASPVSWRWVLRSLIGLFVFGMVVLVAVVAVFVFSQHLEVVHLPSGTFIDVQALGEYQANVRRLRVTAASTGTVVWELEATNHSFALHTVPLLPGENAALPESLEGVSVVTPAKSPAFLLSRGKEYRVDLWTFVNRVPRHVSNSFILP